LNATASHVGFMIFVAGRWLGGLWYPRFSRRWNHSRDDRNWGNYLQRNNVVY